MICKCVQYGSQFKFAMEAMQEENCMEEFEQVYNLNKSTDDWLFDQIISQLQEIVIDPHFQQSLANFMRTNWNIFDQNCSVQQLDQVFTQYRTQMNSYLQNNIRRKVPEFEWARFQQLLKNRRHMIDEQILDTLQSLENSEHFKSFIGDYRNAHEEEERLKVLTIKSNKISQNKMVKGKDNIFNSGQNKNTFDKGLKSTVPKKRESKDKAEDQLLVPELILTVKSMRKC